MYNLDLNDLPLDRLSEQKQKRRRGKQGIALPKLPSTVEERKVNYFKIKVIPRSSRPLGALEVKKVDPYMYFKSKILLGVGVNFFGGWLAISLGWVMAF